MNPLQRTGAIAGAFLLACCGGLLGIGLVTGDSKNETLTGTSQTVTTTAADEPAADPLLGDASASPSVEETAATDPAATAATTDPAATDPAATDPTTAAPVVTTKTVKQTKSIPYGTREVEDDSLAEGKTKVRVKGVNGVRTITYQVTLTDGEETARKQISSVVTRKPVTKVIAIGTKQAGDGCNPNYSPCVPIASDVDCAGGSGNGPVYVDGPIQVIGSDPYDLDRDGDGVACDS
ncbi:G5 domain-containing protein [Actinoplanes sp. CA-030573]|uniref:G5 domain-containing protein n=1 Tax=Actinoplanes sp. CA-030573 TaxID=3239898 RepID=UPI003D8C7C92